MASRMQDSRRSGGLIDIDRRVAEVLSYQHRVEMFERLILAHSEQVREQAAIRKPLRDMLARCEEALTQSATSRIIDPRDA